MCSVPESVLVKTEHHFYIFYVTHFSPGDWHPSANLLVSASFSILNLLSWVFLPPGPPNVKSVHLPSWPDVGASWLYSRLSAPGRTQSPALISQLPGPKQSSQNSENFQSWSAMLVICIPEPGTLKPHSKPTGPTLATRWSSYFPFSVNF